MNRRNKTIEQRNRAIYAEFCAHIRNDTPIMLAYAYCAHRYDLSEQRIREIVMEQAKR
jgi:hypothetical protein